MYLEVDQVELNAENVLLHKVHDRSDNVANFIILVAKYNLYRARCRSEMPNSRKLHSELLYIKNKKKYNAINNNTTHKHEKKWHKVIVNTNIAEVISNDFVMDYINQMD